MKKLGFGALLFFAATLFTATNASAIVDVEGRYWLTTMDDEIKSGTAGTTINLVDDLGVDDKENFFDVRATLEIGSHKLRYGYMPLSWEGTKSTGTISFNGSSFSGVVNTKLDIAYHRLGYEYDIIDTLNNRLGVIFEIKYFDMDASLTSTAPGPSETANIKAPVPTVGVAAQVGLPFLLSVGGEVTGISLGSAAWLVDAEAGVNFKPAPFVVVSGGYRLLKLHLDYNDDLADISVNGPFVMLRADF